MTILLLELETIRMATIFEAGRRLTRTVPTDVYLINLRRAIMGIDLTVSGETKLTGLVGGSGITSSFSRVCTLLLSLRLALTRCI